MSLQKKKKEEEKYCGTGYKKTYKSILPSMRGEKYEV
jgi:hypothetical protein